MLSDYTEQAATYVTDPRTGEPLRAEERRAAEHAAEAAQLAARRADEARRAARRPTLDALKAKHGENRGLRHAPLRESEAHRAARNDRLADANRRAFARDCAAAGIDPAGGVSPSLLRLIKDRPCP